PEAEAVIREYIDRQKKIFFAFNPWLPGVDEIRSSMSSRLETLLRNFLDSRTLGQSHALNHLLGLMRTDPPLPRGYAGDLAIGRYYQQGIKRAKERGIENIHLPHSYAASFRAAQKAVKGKYDVALIVGPEGFSYEPIFQDLGLATLAVNIPEANFGGRRSIAIFDDLSRLTGKRVLVLEDDVRSGATLRKLLEEIKIYEPGYLGLYLGLPSIRQMTQNIPPEFRKVYVTEIDNEKD